MQSLLALCAALGLFSSASAHMSLSYPTPFRSALNPNVPQASIDYSITSPLSPDGSNFPCKGYQSDLGTPAGKSVATWTAGSQHNFTVLGSATHGGGSCQAALSYDKGVSWKVIHSYQGSCPLSNGQSFDFTIPSDAPATGADGTIFTWLWYNEIGNREIYMSCASVDVSAGSGSAPSTAYASRPDLFVANLGNGCTTVEGKEVQFPNPGPSADVTDKYSVADDSGSFTGTCAAVKGIGGASGSSSSSTGSNSSVPAASSGSSVASSVAASSQQPTTLATSAYSIPSLSIPSSTASSGGIFATTAASSSVAVSPSSVESSAPSAASSAPLSTGTGTGSSGLTVSEDGECSGAYTCQGSVHGPCCSQWGWCGSTDAYCGTGCMEGFGQCGTFVNSTSPSGASAPTGAKFRIRV